jgi:hypothetical protein
VLETTWRVGSAERLLTERPRRRGHCPYDGAGPGCAKPGNGRCRSSPRGGASAGGRLTIGRASRDRRSQPIFNSYKPFTIWVAHHAPGTKTVADLVKFPSFEDPREPENSNPKVELVEEILLSRDLAKVPSKLRWYYRLQQHSRSWSRTGTIIQHSRCSRCWCASRGRCLTAYRCCGIRRARCGAA